MKKRIVTVTTIRPDGKHTESNILDKSFYFQGFKERVENMTDKEWEDYKKNLFS